MGSGIRIMLGHSGRSRPGRVSAHLLRRLTGRGVGIRQRPDFGGGIGGFCRLFGPGWDGGVCLRHLRRIGGQVLVHDALHNRLVRYAARELFQVLVQLFFQPLQADVVVGRLRADDRVCRHRNGKRERGKLVQCRIIEHNTGLDRTGNGQHLLGQDHRNRGAADCHRRGAVGKLVI